MALYEKDDTAGIRHTARDRGWRGSGCGTQTSQTLRVKVEKHIGQSPGLFIRSSGLVFAA
jgi:hypothetical protein